MSATISFNAEFCAHLANSLIRVLLASNCNTNASLRRDCVDLIADLRTLVRILNSTWSNMDFLRHGSSLEDGPAGAVLHYRDVLEEMYV